MTYFSPSALAFLVKNAWHIKTGVRLAADKPTAAVLLLRKLYHGR
jgi:hypothetical protein